MRFCIVLLCLFLLPAALSAGEEGPWKIKGFIGVSYNLTAVSNSWTGDERDARSCLLKSEASAERDAGKTNWLTTLKEEFGKAKTGDDTEIENADLIFLDSVFKVKFSMYINPYVGLNVESQHSEFFDPFRLTESIGLGIDIIQKERQNLKTRFGAAFRQEFDPIDVIDGIDFSSTDDPATVEIENSRKEIGAELITNYDFAISESSKFSSEARVFSAFAGGASLRWDNSLFLKIGKVITVQAGYLLIYDYNEDTKPRWPKDIETRLTLALGLSYNIF